MARKLLGAFGLKAATWAPGQLLRVVRMEKHRRIAWDGPSCDELSKSVDSAICQLVQADKEAWADLAAARVRVSAGRRARAGCGARRVLLRCHPLVRVVAVADSAGTVAMRTRTGARTHTHTHTPPCPCCCRCCCDAVRSRACVWPRCAEQERGGDPRCHPHALQQHR
jgi:hypothetical protein